MNPSVGVAGGKPPRDQAVDVVVVARQRRDQADITANLEVLQRSGIGASTSSACSTCVTSRRSTSVSVQGVVEALAHAVHEAHRLGMDADMSPVPGWAFGGPWVTRDDACSEAEVTRLSLEECRKKGMRIEGFAKETPGVPEVAIFRRHGQSGDGIMVDVTAQVDEEGILRWTLPPGTWTINTAMACVGRSWGECPPTTVTAGWLTIFVQL